MSNNNLKLYTHCLRCGRRLKNEQAKQLGYGAVCIKKIQVDKRVPLFDFKR